MRNSFFIGTSGWSYHSWRGSFFPDEMSAADNLVYYATQFRTTELNTVFYRTPSEEIVRSWRKRTPPDFVFAWKASKYITHWKRLTESSVNSLELMESRLRLLGTKAGPVLLQLPPHFKKNRERLGSFIKLLNRRRRYAFEFRHPSWYEDDILVLLRDANVALCLSDHRDAPSPWVATAEHVYIRGHGPAGDYRDHYPARVLSRWARRIERWKAENRSVYVYFDNDQKSAAPGDAARLIEQLSRHSSRNPSRCGSV
jgi:uncharacterized protein YecE (DUF72 family)